MRSNRAWILAGAALSAGIGFVFVLGSRHPRLGPHSRLLLVGDSMAVGLAPHLSALAEDEGVPFRAVAQQGTTITDWGLGAQASELGAALESFRPTIVLVALGTNDEYLSEAALEAEEDDLDALLEQLACYDVAWVGVPALPKESNGAVAMIRSTGVPYFPSQNLTLERAADRLHPTVSGYAKWAGMLWSWLS